MKKIILSCFFLIIVGVTKAKILSIPDKSSLIANGVDANSKGFIETSDSKVVSSLSIQNYSISEAVNVIIPLTNIVTSQCGSTLEAITTPIFASEVSQATAYRFEVSNGVNILGTYESANRYFQLSQIAGVAYGTTYGIRVAVTYNGILQPYGDSCNVTTPTSIPLTKIVTSQCGSAISAITRPIWANEVYQATAYRFEVSNGVNILGTYESANRYFQLSQIAGVAYGTTYGIRVAVTYNGILQPYGDSCKLTTPTLIPQSNIVTSQCGSTVEAITASIYANEVYQATAYRFEVSNGVNILGTYESANKYFQLSQIAGVAYGTTYGIRVAVTYNGILQPYGDSCNVTTPTSIPLTKIVTSQCGSTVASITRRIWANEVYQATAYRFEVSNGLNILGTYESANGYFQLSQIAGVAYGTTYGIRVAVTYNGILQPYGDSCNITTPTIIPLTKIVTSQCGSTVASINSSIYASEVYQATAYRFEVSNGVNILGTYESANRYFQLSQIAGVAYGTTYGIRVAVTYNGILQPYGDSCNVTTIATAQTFCNAATVADLVTTVNDIQWYAGATGGTALIGTAALATGTYYATQTISSPESTTRTAVAVTVNVTAAPTSSAQTFCNAATVTDLVATGTAIQWYDAATGGTPLATSTDLATGTYYASQTLNACESATRTVAAVTVNITAAPTASAQTFCNAGTVTNLVAIGDAIQWYDAATGGTPLAISTDLATRTYYASQTLDACESTTRTAVAVLVNVTLAPTASAQTFSNSATVSNLVASGTAIQWYTSAAGGTALLSSTTVSTGTYYATQTINSCESASRTIVSITVNLPPTKIVTSQCGSTVAAITSSIFASEVSQATAYRFEVSNGVNILGTYESANRYFQLSQIAGVAYGTTYGIRVAVRYNGILQPYGDSCNVTTPTLIPLTKIVTSQCGSTISAITRPIWANEVYQATAYRFEVSNGVNILGTYESANRYFQLSQIAGVAYGTTYGIRVAVRYNGILQPYGDSCNVTIPTLIPLTKIVTSQCGSTVEAITSSIFASEVSQATAYRFEVSNGLNILGTYESANRYFQLSQIAGVAYGSTYGIRVAVTYNGILQPYGDSCNVTTPTSIPLTKIVTSQCGSTVASITRRIWANEVYQATAYRFEVSNGLNILGTYESANGYFQLSQIAGVAYGTTYGIRVAVTYNGILQPYGDSCTITTPTARITNDETFNNILTVKLYPNPFISSFSMLIDSSSDELVEMKVYDMIGRQIHTRKATVSEWSGLEEGNNYPSGVYNIIITQGENIKYLRVIKR